MSIGYSNKFNREFNKYNKKQTVIGYNWKNNNYEELEERKIV